MDVLDPRDAEPAQRDALMAWLAIQRAFALRPQKLPTRFRSTSEPERHLGDHAVAALSPSEGDRVLRVLARQHARLVPISSPLYPSRLAALGDAPPVLVVRGNPALLGVRCVGMVGARAATRYGLTMAEEIAHDLARAGFAVVSGLARGVDAAAHRGAIAGGGATLAFQACGPETIYPASHRALAGEIIGRGALLTEFPVGTPPRAPYFPLRNRLISGISEALIVVEARIRSGSLTTARHAAEQGVDVWALPGAVDRPTSEGPLHLIRDGAGVLTCARDLLEVLGCGDPERSKSAEVRRPEPSDPLQLRLWRELLSEPKSAAELSEALGIAASPLGAALATLEVEGRIELDRDGRFSVVAGAPVSSPPGERL
jgi:DNA processing protein